MSTSTTKPKVGIGPDFDLVSYLQLVRAVTVHPVDVDEDDEPPLREEVKVAGFPRPLGTETMLCYANRNVEFFLKAVGFNRSLVDDMSIWLQKQIDIELDFNEVPLPDEVGARRGLHLRELQSMAVRQAIRLQFIDRLIAEVQCGINEDHQWRLT